MHDRGDPDNSSFEIRHGCMTKPVLRDQMTNPGMTQDLGQLPMFHSTKCGLSSDGGTYDAGTTRHVERRRTMQTR
jgi:hypothetical protein